MKCIQKKYLCFSKVKTIWDNSPQLKFSKLSKACGNTWTKGAKELKGSCPKCGSNRSKLISRIIYEDEYAPKEVTVENGKK